MTAVAPEPAYSYVGSAPAVGVNRSRTPSGVCPEVTEQVSSRRLKKMKRKRETSAQALEREEKYIKSHFHQNREQATGSERVETKAFGRIDFEPKVKGSHKPRYIRIDDRDSHDDLVDLLLNHWQLPLPTLIVSIVGGAESFQIKKSRKIKMFKQGLLNLATTTGAWILTPGSNNGVYEMVGSAVKDHLDATTSASIDDIVLLGIASWGSVAERSRLENLSEGGRVPACYPITKVMANTQAPEGEKRQDVKTEPLNPNHSHFILVDDGLENAVGRESEWRTKFEEFLTSHETSASDQNSGSNSRGERVSIPMVKLLVNGEDDVLEGCSDSLFSRIPLVAVAGSGKAAEVVAKIHAHCQKQLDDHSPSKDTLAKIYRGVMEKAPSEHVIPFLNIIASNHKYISVFDLNQLGSASDEISLDTVVLSALYHKDELDIAKMKAQMNLAITWNRVDYARDVIFDCGSKLFHKFTEEKKFLQGVATQALLKDLPEFVELLVNQGLDLKAFVTVQRLKSLYKDSMARTDGYSLFVDSVFKQMDFSKEEEFMTSLDKMLQRTVGLTYPNNYMPDDSNNSFIGDQKRTTDVFEDPAQHLFLWATLFNHLELAEIFWKLSKDQIAGALVGATVMRGMARKSNHQESVDITASYQANSERFEQLAIGTLDRCWSEDRQYTSDMLVRVAPNWGNTTVLSLAYHSGMEKFLAQPACYTKLSKIWRGDIALRTPIAKIMLFAFMPFLPWLLKFVKRTDDKQRLDKQRQDSNSVESSQENGHSNQSFSNHRDVLSVTWFGKGDYEIPYFRALIRGNGSPIVKCVHYALWFLTFLTIFALFMMTELRPFTRFASNSSNLTEFESNSSRLPKSFTCRKCCVVADLSCFELITYIYALASISEELRQICFGNKLGMKVGKQRFIDWAKDFWNNLDLLAFVLLVIATSFRFTLPEKHFDYTRWLYSLSFMVYVLRFTQIFYVIEELGPKIIMIKKMMVDLLFFVVILSMTIIIFGVISQTILEPESTLDIDLVTSVVYKPYFQMYGELFLEEYQGYRWILLALYMILTNVLLLNLLIAMFSYTFEKVQEKSETLWKYNYYAVVHEHFDRPYFLVIGTLIQICRHSSATTSSDFTKKLDKANNTKITKFVNACMERYLAQESRERREDVAHTVIDTATRQEKMSEQLGDLRDDVVCLKSALLDAEY